MYHTRSITQTEIHDQAHALLQRHLKAKDYGKKCTGPVLISLLLFAATCMASLSAVCRRLKNSPSDETVRLALLATLPAECTLRRRINEALAELLPKALRKRSRAWPLAVDLWDMPYYGRQNRAVRRGPKKASTVKRYSYATAFVVRKGYRFTLAVTEVAPGDKLVEVLSRLLKRVKELGIRVRFVLLDRGFYAADVVCYLKRSHRPFIMPTKHTGRTPKDPNKAKSTRRFLRWRRSGYAEYSWKGSNGQQASVRIAVSIRRYQHEGKNKRQVLVFAFWGFEPMSPRWLRETYRTRFAIESSFRQGNQARIRTCTPDKQRRFLFIAIALIIRNVWAWIHLVRLVHGNHLRLEVLPFVDMLHTIHSFIDLLFRCITIFGLPKPSLAKI
jgi:hypothetical protein